MAVVVVTNKTFIAMVTNKSCCRGYKQVLWPLLQTNLVAMVANRTVFNHGCHEQTAVVNLSWL